MTPPTQPILCSISTSCSDKSYAIVISFLLLPSLLLTLTITEINKEDNECKLSVLHISVPTVVKWNTRWSPRYKRRTCAQRMRVNCVPNSISPILLHIRRISSDAGICASPIIPGSVLADCSPLPTKYIYEG
jgi:hypothetical protein